MPKLLEGPETVRNTMSIFTLDTTPLPELTGSQLFVLLRTYPPASEPINQFVIQDGNRFLDLRGNELPLAPGTSYAKCYNWSQFYSADQDTNPYDGRLSWSDDSTPGGNLRDDYCTLRWGREFVAGDKFVVYRHYENGEIAEAGIAKWRQEGFVDDKFFRADGTQITDDIHYIQIGDWFNERILRGDLDPTDATMNSMGWIPQLPRPVQPAAAAPAQQQARAQKAVQKSPQGGQQGSKIKTSKPAYQTITLTFYYVPYAEEKRFGGDVKILKDNGKLNGTYRDANGIYRRWLPKDVFENVSGPTTNSGNAPTADWTLAVPPEWRDKYIAIVRDGELVVRGYGEDSGGAFTPGSSKIDVYAGEGESAYKHGINNYNGTCRAYFFDTRAAMNTFINGL
ncbi:MAG: hypothetical protein Q7T16_02285 [Candidatus Burarchaeum sp.]|nr:hypothetical protein [Candidatus Burarchaeum sp.]MDO8339462.1 hypothetical protein [Candidatus Burarchaeum sp.]